ncbi:uncharacterized protein LOC128671794 [Plodia interpunctella]|uniref:uncharacterized protein LOC128671794 n=1 Tax=Plodia interpunctella TaxID=58824 RepID=UPI002367E883|nr:uncharacterized protein LOC128671794 [Plodia interpunctella]
MSITIQLNMAAKLLIIFVLAAFVSQGICVTEITLDDETTTFITNPLIAKTITIPKLFLDVLEACYVVMPNGIMYEFYPNNNIVEDPIFVLQAVAPFNSCGLGFRNAPVSFSGTYELFSLVKHTADGSQSLTRKKFHITFIESEVVFPNNEVVQTA